MPQFDNDSSLRIYMREISQTPLLKPKEELELANRIKKGDKAARAHMIKANLRLVVKIAQDYSGYGLPLSDLISEGNIGLMKAVERFDPNKGGKMSTYASWWIKQSIKRGLANQSKTIRLPVHAIEKIVILRRISNMLSEELGHEPTDDELAEELGIPIKKIAFIKETAQRPTSLDEPFGQDDSETKFNEVIEDKKAINPLEALAGKDNLEDIDELLEILDERERKIIDARFGLNGKVPMTLEEVGDEFGLTRERIRQLQNVALGKMRRALKIKNGESIAEDNKPKKKRTGKKETKITRVGKLLVQFSEAAQNTLLKDLNTELQNIIIKRCGLNEEPAKGHQELIKEFNLSASQVVYRQNKAMKEISKAAKSLKSQTSTSEADRDLAQKLIETIGIK